MGLRDTIGPYQNTSAQPSLGASSDVLAVRRGQQERGGMDSLAHTYRRSVMFVLRCR